MLYVYTGNDTVAVRKKAYEHIAALAAGGANIERVNAEECTKDFLRNRIGAQSLFGIEGGGEITILDTISEKKDVFDALLELVKDVNDSRNIFFIIDKKQLAKPVKILKEHSEVYEIIETAPDERFNAFALADAYARRDKKSLWVLLHRARRAGLSGEEIIGTLLWQLKAMRLASRTSGAEESGLKPFVYTKAKKSIMQFKEGDVDLHARNLLSVYHGAHVGECDMDMALEHWVLSI